MRYARGGAQRAPAGTGGAEQQVARVPAPSLRPPPLDLEFSPAACSCAAPARQLRNRKASDQRLQIARRRRSRRRNGKRLPSARISPLQKAACEAGKSIALIAAPTRHQSSPSAPAGKPAWAAG